MVLYDLEAAAKKMSNHRFGSGSLFNQKNPVHEMNCKTNEKRRGAKVFVLKSEKNEDRIKPEKYLVFLYFSQQNGLLKFRTQRHLLRLFCFPFINLLQGVIYESDHRIHQVL